MNLCQCPNQWMMDEEVDHDGGYEQAQGSIDAMDPSYQNPCRLELLALVIRCNITSSRRGSSFPLLSCSQRCLCLLSSYQFDNIGQEEVAGYDEI